MDDWNLKRHPIEKEHHLNQTSMTLGSNVSIFVVWFTIADDVMFWINLVGTIGIQECWKWSDLPSGRQRVERHNRQFFLLGRGMNISKSETCGTQLRKCLAKKLFGRNAILNIWEPEHICHEIKYLDFSFLLKKMAAVAVYCGQTRVLGSMASQKSMGPSFYGDLSRLRCVGVDQLPLWIPMVGMVINV